MSSHRRPAFLAAAVLTAATLGTAAFVIPATAADAVPAAGAPAAAAPVKVIGGTLDWGLLADYRAYVTGMAKGTITVADGAKTNADGSLQFGEATGAYDEAAGNVLKAAFKGSVTFSSPAPPVGHGFEVKLSDFRIDTGTRKVTADVTKDGSTTQDVPLADVAFGRPPMEKLATVLTKETADALRATRYEKLAGDPLTVKVQFESPSPGTSTGTSPSTSPKPSTTGGTPPADGVQKLLAGRLRWGVKESLRSYVTSVTPAAGAVKDGESFSFAFGKGELDTRKQKLSASFEGSLRFRHADHGIDMTFANVRVNTEGDKGTLVLDVITPEGAKTNVPFATLSLPKTEYKTQDKVLALNGVRAALTAEGAAAFTYKGEPMYKTGVRIDDVNLSVGLDKDATLPSTGGTGTTGGSNTTGGSGTTGGSTGTTTGGTTTGGTVGGSSGSSGSSGTTGTTGSSGGSVGGKLASTGAEIPAGALLGASGAVIAAGAGAVYVARRRRTAGN
ncbi:HtaA domain-containing protein [Streptomyces lavendulae]|uniref:HtaA domain-containing protein n=1 Tax=Streptomyces lavendulae TaxID=1914 RepID=UPI0031E959BC